MEEPDAGEFESGGDEFDAEFEGIGEAEPVAEAPKRRESAREPSETTWDDIPPPAPSAPAPEAKSDVRAGQVAHDIPDRMMVAIKVPVTARLVEGAPDDLTDGMSGATVQEVLVTKAMSARLVAPDGGFLIEGSSPETQWIYGAPEPALQTDHAHWNWQVTPTERGKRRLQLVLTARTVDARGMAAETALPEQVVEVRVQTNVRRNAFQIGMWAVATLLGGAVARFGSQIVQAIEDLAGM